MMQLVSIQYKSKNEWTVCLLKVGGFLNNNINIALQRNTKLCDASTIYAITEKGGKIVCLDRSHQN